MIYINLYDLTRDAETSSAWQYKTNQYKTNPVH